MKKSSYADINAIVNVIGNIYKNPKLIEASDKYSFDEDDFVSSFQKVVFGSIYNLYQLGAKEISLQAIEDYLATRPKQYGIYKDNKGPEYILNCADSADITTFPYYYNRMKKMTLLRAYADLGIDLKWLYDADNILDIKKKEKQEEWLDNADLSAIVDAVNDKIDAIKLRYADGVDNSGSQIGDGIDEYLESLKQSPAFGLPLYGRYMNTISRGARFGKFFLFSAATGVGKSRSMIAQACNLGCSQMYDLIENKWKSVGACQPTLFIATEQDLKEIQSMAISFIAGVDEEHILTGEYFTGEWERVAKAAQLLKQSKIYFECLPDFSMSDIENTIKYHIREHGVKFIFFDYIHSSAKILMEVGGKGGVKNLREDNVLFLLSSKLKDIAVQYDVFIWSSTQLNSSYQESGIADQNALRGSKAIADRVDLGAIMLEVTADDIEKIKPFCQKNGLPLPNIKISVYKNRQGQHKGIILWLDANRGCCRFDPVFATKFDYSILDIPDIKIKVEEDSAF